MSLPADWRSDLGTIADVLGILGFLLTVFVALSVRTIKRDYLFRGTVPKLFDALIDHASKINDFLAIADQEERSVRINTRLKQVEGTLESLVVQLKGGRKKSVKGLLSVVRRYGKSTQKDPTLVQGIYDDTQKVIQQLQDLIEERRWQ